MNVDMARKNLSSLQNGKVAVEEQLLVVSDKLVVRGLNGWLV